MIAVRANAAGGAEEEAAAPPAGSSFDFDLQRHVEQHVRRRRQQAETQENTLVGDTALASQLPAPGDPSDPSERTEVDPAGRRGRAEAAEAAPPPQGATGQGAAAPRARRGQTATARRILVECGLCGYLVQIPAEFFGKTVHCPECAGNTVFTESTLDPVKDELLDRLALETNERRALFPAAPAGRWFTRNALQSFVIGVGLGLILLLLLWGGLRLRAAGDRDAAVERAVQAGWRYATNAGSNVVHEPWCPQLDPQRTGRRLRRDELEAAADLERHACGE